VTVLGEGELPERKDYVARLQFHKQEALASPRFEPLIHGDQPKLQRLIMRPMVFRFDLAAPQRVQGASRWQAPVHQRFRGRHVIPGDGPETLPEGGPHAHGGPWPHH